MIGYVTVGSNRLDDAKRFYDALLGSIGMSPLFEHGSGGRVYGAEGSAMFGVVGPFNGEPASVGNGSMCSFTLPDREAVHAFHATAIKLGGVDDGAPGVRGPDEARAFMGYVRDLDGNKLCAMKLG